jgi:hypothetical protein
MLKEERRTAGEVLFNNVTTPQKFADVQAESLYRLAFG